jgi:hypothetical protein
VLLALAASNRSQAAGERGSTNLFPYAYSVDDLPNGLRLVTVPTDCPNMVALCPEYATVLIVGDVTRDHSLELTTKYMT